ncbi:Multiple inositol polyphosphate phosphatase [Phytophthora cinnamomi]|uniref:Multiple inositol polyphosphate phosphatase n=1 Tax=Phytophthora cinnamomi TaxID=4785 RepID=UPI00355998D9|nr:Multiple inositol polyphosphate phosphatase [Phytophthora cinnamomi]
MRATRSSSAQPPADHDSSTANAPAPRRKRQFETLSQHPSKDAALGAMLRRDGCTYRHLHNQGKRSPTSLYQCVSHAQCPKRIRLVVRRSDAGASLVSLEQDDVAHNDNDDNDDNDAAERRRGISPLLKDEVDAILKAGAGPKQCRLVLVERHQHDDDVLRLLPDETTLKNRKATLKKKKNAPKTGSWPAMKPFNRQLNQSNDDDEGVEVVREGQDGGGDATKPDTEGVAAECVRPSQSQERAETESLTAGARTSPSADASGGSSQTTEAKLEVVFQRFTAESERQREEREQEHVRFTEQQELQRQTIELQKRALDMQEKAINMQDRLMALMEKVMDKIN